MNFLDSTFEKWNKWLDVIYLDIIKLSLERDIFREVQKMIKNNVKIQKPSVFYDFLGKAYIASSVMTIRRQTKEKDSISFLRLGSVNK